MMWKMMEVTKNFAPNEVECQTMIKINTIPSMYISFSKYSVLDNLEIFMQSYKFCEPYILFENYIAFEINQATLSTT